MKDDSVITGLIWEKEVSLIRGKFSLKRRKAYCSGLLWQNVQVVGLKRGNSDILKGLLGEKCSWFD